MSADCNVCGNLCTSVHDWVVNKVKAGHELRKPGHKVNITGEPYITNVQDM